MGKVFRHLTIPTFQPVWQFCLQSLFCQLTIIDIQIKVDYSLLTEPSEYVISQLTDHVNQFRRDAHQFIFLAGIGPFLPETGKPFKQSGEYCLVFHKSFVILLFFPFVMRFTIGFCCVIVHAAKIVNPLQNRSLLTVKIWDYKII